MRSDLFLQASSPGKADCAQDARAYAFRRSRTARKLRSTDHLLSCSVYGERFGRCVLRPGDARKLVGAGRSNLALMLVSQASLVLHPLRERLQVGATAPPHAQIVGWGFFLEPQNRFFRQIRPSAGGKRGTAPH